MFFSISKDYIVIWPWGPVSIYTKDVFEMVGDRNAASSLAESSQRSLCKDVFCLLKHTPLMGGVLENTNVSSKSRVFILYVYVSPVAACIHLIARIVCTTYIWTCFLSYPILSYHILSYPILSPFTCVQYGLSRLQLLGHQPSWVPVDHLRTQLFLSSRKYQRCSVVSASKCFNEGWWTRYTSKPSPPKEEKH